MLTAADDSLGFGAFWLFQNGPMQSGFHENVRALL